MKKSIPREFSLKKAVLSGIALLSSIMMLLALCFSLMEGEIEEISYNPVTGATTFYGTSMFMENGFTMLAFDALDLKPLPQYFHWGTILAGIFCLLHLIVSLLLIVGNVFSFLLAPKKVNSKITMASTIVNVAFPFFICLRGSFSQQFTTRCICPFISPLPISPLSSPFWSQLHILFASV